MRIFLGVHVLYFMLVIIYTVQHGINPVRKMDRTYSRMLQIKEKYNALIKEKDVENKSIYSLKGLFMLKDLVVYSDVVGCKEVEDILNKPEESYREIVRLHTKLKESIDVPKRYYLKYSLECNLGILCSLILPSLLVVLTNIKGIIKRQNYSYTVS